MRTTIDKAGRVVIPASLRARAGLRPGMKLEVECEGSSVRLIPCVPRPRLVERHGRLVAVPSTPPEDAEPDVAKLVEQERDRWPI